MCCKLNGCILPIILFLIYPVLGALMGKSLCKWKKKDIEKHFHELLIIVDKPKYICKECARCAHNKGHLCKALKIPFNHEP